MQDPRTQPLEFEPERPSLLESYRNFLIIGRTRRNKREQRQARAAEANAPFRAAEARTRAALQGRAPQDGTDAVVRQGLAMLGRVGRGGR